MSSETGKRLLDELVRLYGLDHESFGEAIAAIEAEARRAALTDLRKKVAGMPTWDKRSVPGGLHVSRAAVLVEIDQALEGETP
jgi:hypothetical protein